MKNDRLLNAEAVARMLIEVLPSPSPPPHSDDVRVEEYDFSPLDETEPQGIGELRWNAAVLLNELEFLLSMANWIPESDMPLIATGNQWTLGHIEKEAPLRKIHHGHLLPVKKFPILEDVSDRAIAFLTKISGWSDYVKRENHPGVGWHYHYLSAAKKRSDVLLAWDTRWQPPLGADPLRPFFGEKHAEGKADFSARPWLWGDKKKASMYAVCQGDLEKWAIGEFRCASQDAEAVWPTGTLVTPIPTTSSSIHSSSRKSRRH